MNRSQLRELLARMQESNPGVDFVLQPRLVRHPMLVRSQYRVDVTVRVTRSLYFDPNIDLTDDDARNMMQEEIRAIQDGVAEHRLSAARADYLRREAPRNAVAREMLSSRPLVLNDNPAPVLPAPESPRTRPHLMLRPPVSVAIEPGLPRRPVIVPDPPAATAETLEAGEPTTLWERLEDS